MKAWFFDFRGEGAREPRERRVFFQGTNQRCGASFLRSQRERGVIFFFFDFQGEVEPGIECGFLGEKEKE